MSANATQKPGISVVGTCAISILRKINYYTSYYTNYLIDTESQLWHTANVLMGRITLWDIN